MRDVRVVTYHSSNGIVTMDSNRSVRGLYALPAAVPWVLAEFARRQQRNP